MPNRYFSDYYCDMCDMYTGQMPRFCASCGTEITRCVACYQHVNLCFDCCRKEAETELDKPVTKKDNPDGNKK